MSSERGEQGAWAEALELYEQALSFDPSPGSIHTRLHHARREIEADRWIDQGDRAHQREAWREAYESYEQARLLTSMPERVRDRLDVARNGLVRELGEAARAAERDGRYDDALANYHAVLEVQPHDADALAEYDALAGRMRTAEQAYRQARRALRATDLMTARKHFRACTDALPAYRDAAEQLADVRRNLILAETLYDRAVDADRKGRSDRASVLYEECLAVARPFRDAQERLEEAQSVAWRDDDRYEPYILGYRDIDARLRQIVSMLDLAAAAYARAGKAVRDDQLEAARDAYTECLTNAGGYRDAVERLAEVEASLELLRDAQSFERQRRLTDARDRYRKLLDRHPTHPVAKKRVRELDEECRTLDPSYAALVDAERRKDYRDALRRAAFEDAGRWKLAGRAYERCVELDPKFRDARERRDRCLARAEQRPRGSDRDWNKGRGHRSARGERSDRD